MPFPRQPMKRLGVFCLLLALLTQGGCAGVYGFKENPKVSIADIRIQDVKAMEGVFLIKLRVLNPNDVPLELHGINCDLQVNQRHFASGTTSSNQEVPAMGTAVIPVEVYASVLDVVASAADLLRRAGMKPSKDKVIPYTMQGAVRIAVHGFKRDVPFQASGELPLKGLTPVR